MADCQETTMRIVASGSIVGGCCYNFFDCARIRLRARQTGPSRHRWMLVPALFDTRGRIRPDHVRVKSKDETHAERSYFIEWWDHGQRHREAVGPNAQEANLQVVPKSSGTCNSWEDNLHFQ